MEKKRTYTIGEFAEKTGTSIRTLHYYDEIGLLQPAKDPRSGHRVYDDDDLLKLQKIVSLKLLGFRLNQIKRMIHAADFPQQLKSSLQKQNLALLEQKEQIETMLNVIHRTMRLLNDEEEVDSEILTSLIRSMQTEKEQRAWFEQQFSEEVADRLYKKSEEEMMALDKVFIQLSKKVKALAGMPPNAPEVQAMIKEYWDATLQFVGEEILQDLSALDLAGAEELVEKLPTPFTKEEEEWLNEAMAYFMDRHGMCEFGGSVV